MNKMDDRIEQDQGNAVIGSDVPPIRSSKETVPAKKVIRAITASGALQKKRIGNMVMFSIHSTDGDGKPKEIAQVASKCNGSIPCDEILDIGFQLPAENRARFAGEIQRQLQSDFGDTLRDLLTLK